MSHFRGTCKTCGFVSRQRPRFDAHFDEDGNCKAERCQATKPVCTGQNCRDSSKKNLQTDPHGCPYQSEINDDDNEEYCTCCDECRRECRE